MRAIHPSAVLEAAGLLAGTAHRTPVFTSRTLDGLLGASVLFKAESLQRGGAFKFRGAFNALSRMDPDVRRRGVLTWSSGNHAGALALAGRILDVPVTVVMPSDAMPLKRDAVLGYGAEVIPCRAEEREIVGRGVAEERSIPVIPPYDHPDVIAGQGTAALELIQDFGPLEAILAPVGGGGLLSGTALAVAAAFRDAGSPAEHAVAVAAADGGMAGPSAAAVHGVEPAVADDAARSLHEDRIVVLDKSPPTIADGLRTRFLGEHTFAVIRDRVAGIVTVTEDEILEALRFLWLRMKLVVEPSGAVPLAALLAGKIDAKGRRVGVILSGGNADPRQVGEWIVRGLGGG